MIREKLLLVLQDPHTQYVCVIEEKLEELHDAFYDLIDRRSALIHGRPATALDGARRRVTGTQLPGVQVREVFRLHVVTRGCPALHARCLGS